MLVLHLARARLKNSVCGVKQRLPSPALSQWSSDTSAQGCWPWDVNPPQPGVTGLVKSVNLVLWGDDDVWFEHAHGSRLLGRNQTAFTAAWTFLKRKQCWSVKVLFCLWFICQPYSSAWPKVKKPLIICLCMWKNAPINVKMRKGLPPPRVAAATFDQLYLTTVPYPFTQKYNTDIWNPPCRGWKCDPSSQTSCWALSSSKQIGLFFGKICHSDCVQA